MITWRKNYVHFDDSDGDVIDYDDLLKYNFSSPGFDGGLQQQFLLAIFRTKVTQHHGFANSVTIIMIAIMVVSLSSSPSSLLASAVCNKYRFQKNCWDDLLKM